MTQQVLDLDGGVVGNARELRVQCLHDAHGVGDAIEKVGIAKGDVLGAGRHLLADVGQHNVPRNHAKLPGVDRNDRAVPAEMFAAAGSFGVAGSAVQAVGKNDVGVIAQSGQIAAVG